MVAVTADSALPRTAPRAGRWFYVGIAGLCVLVAFGGFVPTYWALVAAGSFHGAPILHLHGALFFSWTLFFFAQTAMVAAGRTPDHRAWGLAGISLATGMVFTVVLGSINSMRMAEAAGLGDAARRFSIVALGSVLVFAALLATAIAKVKRPEVHKRLMLVAMVPLMHAALARVFFTLFAPPGDAGPPPVLVTVPSALAADLLLVVALLHDWRSRGRPHPVYLVCGPLLVAEQLLAVPISHSSSWVAIAAWVQSLAG